MEQIRYGGTSFELVPNGLDDFTDGKLILRHRTGDKNLEGIKAIAKNVKTTDSIDLLDGFGTLIRSIEGYIYAGEIQEVENYLDIQEGTQEQTNVAIVTFKLPDIRTELENIKSIQEYILISMLEGGV